MAKVAIFGGTFDPIHNGHLLAAREVVQRLHVDKVLFVPTGNSYQKSNTTPADMRVEMIKLAIEGDPKFAVDLADVNRPGPTYTIDTLRELKAKYPHDDLFFMLGTDALAGIETWKDYKSLFDLAIFVVVTRPGSALKLIPEIKHRVTVLEIPALNLSSTFVRVESDHDRSIADLVPAKVANYIKTNKLYEVKA